MINELDLDPGAGAGLKKSVTLVGFADRFSFTYGYVS